MKILGWTFIVLNVVISLAYLRNATRSYNALGRGEIGAPSAWVYVVAANRSSCRHLISPQPLALDLVVLSCRIHRCFHRWQDCDAFRI